MPKIRFLKSTMHEPIKIPYPFDIVDASVDKHLRQLCRRFAGYKREQLTSASAIYWIHGGWKGYVMTRKLDEQLTELSFHEPTAPHSINMTPEQFEWRLQAWEIPSLSDEQKRQQLSESIDEQRTRYNETLKEHNTIILNLLSMLKADNILSLFKEEESEKYLNKVLLIEKTY